MTIASSPVDILQWQRTVAALNILTAAEQAVADALSRRINSGTGVCFPSLKTLAADVGKSVSVAKRTVRKLARAGLLAIRRTGRGSIYRLLRWVGADPSDRPAATPKRAKSTCEVLPPSPRERECAEIEPGIATEQPPAPTPAPTATPEPETPAQADSEAADDITALIAYFWTISGTKADSVRHRKALQQALRSNTRTEIEQAAKVAKASWSNPAWITPAAICKDGRVDELLSQAQTGTASRSAAHTPFSAPRLSLPRAYVEKHREDGEDLAAADARLLFEIRTGKRRMPKAEIAA